MAIKFSVQFTILFLTIVIDGSLFIDLSSQRLYESNVCIYTGLVVLIHSTFVLIQASKVLFEVQQLVLQYLVVTFALSKLICFLHELCDHSLFLSWCTSTMVERATDWGLSLLDLSCFRVRASHLNDVERGSLLGLCGVEATLWTVGAQWAGVAGVKRCHFILFVFCISICSA